jgi:adiponectin receptor
MWGCTLPSVYYGFICDPALQKLYWGMITVLAIACTVATLDPHFSHPTFRAYRAAMYSGLGLSAIIFIAHGLVLYGYETQNKRMSLNWMLLMATFNLTGATIYATRVCAMRW